MKNVFLHELQLSDVPDIMKWVNDKDVMFYFAGMQHEISYVEEYG